MINVITDNHNSYLKTSVKKHGKIYFVNRYEEVIQTFGFTKNYIHLLLMIACYAKWSTHKYFILHNMLSLKANGYKNILSEFVPYKWGTNSLNMYYHNMYYYVTQIT